MTSSRPVRLRGYLTHSAAGAATPETVAELLRSVADDLDEVGAEVGEVVDVTVAPAVRPADGTTVTTYLDTPPR